MNFFTKNPNLKKKENIYFFVFCVGEGGVSDFFLQRIEIYTFFEGGGMEGVVWREGSVARVSEFFLQIIQI